MSVELEAIGSVLAIIGSIVSLWGAYTFNILNNYPMTKKIWCLSNILLWAWSFGYMQHWWIDGLAGAALFGLYGCYTASNIIGLIRDNMPSIRKTIWKYWPPEVLRPE